MNNLETRVRVANAYQAMEMLGISEDKVKPVLKNLLKLFDKNWMHIEEENYRALADAIFEREELQAAEQSKKTINAQTKESLNEEAQATEEPERPLQKFSRRRQVGQTSNKSALDEEAQATEEPERPLKRLRRRHQDGQTSGSATDGKLKTSLIIPKEEPGELPVTDVPRLDGPKSVVESSQPKVQSAAAKTQLITYQSRRRNTGRQPVCPKPLYIMDRCDLSQPSSVSNSQPNTQLRNEPSSETHPIRLRDKGKGAVSIQIPSREKEPVSDSSTLTVSLKEPKVEPGLSPEKKSTRGHALIKPKDEPVTNDFPSLNNPGAICNPDTSNGGNTSRSIMKNNISGPLELQPSGAADDTLTPNEPINNGELQMTSHESSSNLELGSSPSGDVKINLICSLAPGRSGFQMPNLEVVLKHVEDKCFRSPHASGMNISVTRIMEDICQCFLKFGNNSSSQSPKLPMVVSSTSDSVRESFAIDAPSTASLCTSSLNSLVDSQSGAKLPEPQMAVTPPPCNVMNDDGPQLNEMDAGNGLNQLVDSHSMLTEPQTLHSPLRNGLNDDESQLNEMDTGDRLNDLVDSQSGTMLPEPQMPVTPPPCNGLNDDGPQLNKMVAGDGFNGLVNSQSDTKFSESQTLIPPTHCDGMNDPQMNEIDAGDRLNGLVDSQLGAKSPETQTPVPPSPGNNMNDDGPQLNEMEVEDGLIGLVDSQSGTKLPESQPPIHPPPCDDMNDGAPQLNKMDDGDELVDSQLDAKSPKTQALVPPPPCNLNGDGPQLHGMDAEDGLNGLVDSRSCTKLPESQTPVLPSPCDGMNDDAPQLNEMDAGDGLNGFVDSQLGAKSPETQALVPPPPSNNMNGDGPQLHEMDAEDGLNRLVNSQSCTSLPESQTPILPPPCDVMNNDARQPNKMDAGDRLNGFVDSQSGAKLPETQTPVPPSPCNGNGDWPQPNEMDPQVTPEVLSPPHDAFDIAKGQEKVLVTLLNEVNDEVPPSFFYIPQNAVFQNAYVNVSLAHISDNNCCATCSGDCLSSSTPCACAHETGDEFAYTSDGLVREEFLKECISMNRNPTKHCQFFCKKCPLERSKCEDIIEPCKGHLVRKFIKECWCKCSCSIQCGNRVVQRGINRRLQVFMTSEEKGWGLRTLEDLPEGAFICEYVGEVLTNTELFERILRSPGGEKYSYPVLLDADWSAEGEMRDEEALCLDATYYGNVARFINHRCYDSNLVEIPVEIETPDHHYYHLAFFTTRKVKAMEELTWDYGIDFDDQEHPIKAFRCRCGSKFCRNIKRYRRGSRR